MGAEQKPDNETIRFFSGRRIRFYGQNARRFSPRQHEMRIGGDFVTLDRMERLLEELQDELGENFTSDEIAHCENTPRPDIRLQRYAARWAAKEAVIKALGGIAKIGGLRVNLNEISVVKDENGRPLIHLEGKAKERKKTLGIKDIHVSLAHTDEWGHAIILVTRHRKKPTGKRKKIR